LLRTSVESVNWSIVPVGGSERSQGSDTRSRHASTKRLDEAPRPEDAERPVVEQADAVVQRGGHSERVVPDGELLDDLDQGVLPCLVVGRREELEERSAELCGGVELCERRSQPLGVGRVPTSASRVPRRDGRAVARLRVEGSAARVPRPQRPRVLAIYK
jgi:hypothetical protein